MGLPVRYDEHGLGTSQLITKETCLVIENILYLAFQTNPLIRISYVPTDDPLRFELIVSSGKSVDLFLCFIAGSSMFCHFQYAGAAVNATASSPACL